MPPEADPLASATPVEADPLAGATPLAGAESSAVSTPQQKVEASKQRLIRRLTPENFKQMGAVGMQTTAPLAGGEAGAALGAGGAAAGAALGGGASELAVGHDWRSAAKSALINGVFTGAAVGLAGGKAQVAPEMEQTAPTVKNLKQAVRNRDFWKSLGLSDEQATAAMAAPDAEQFYARTVESAQRTKAAYQTVIDNTRADFTARYNDAYGDLAKTEVPIQQIGTSIKQQLQVGQHELTPTFANFLKRKAAEFGGPAPEEVLTDKIVEKPGGEYYEPPPYDPRQDEALIKLGIPKKRVAEMSTGAKENYLKQARAQGLISELPGEKPTTIEDLRKFRTELRENLPSNATNLDRKAFNQINQQIDAVHDKTMTDAGANAERLGRIKGIDSDYSRLVDTMQQIDPRNEKFSATVNSALWDKSLQNPDQAANLIRMAKAAEVNHPGVMSDLRSSFLEKAVAETRVGAQPMDEMKALQKLQKQWGDAKGTQVVLNEMFGKDSPFANQVTLAKVLGEPVDKEKLSWAANMTQRAAAAPYLLRAGVIYGLAGGGMLAITRDPEKAAIAIAGLAGLQIGGKLAARLSATGQQAWVNFRLNPSETNFKTLMRVSGAMIGADLSAGGSAGGSASPAESR